MGIRTAVYFSLVGLAGVGMLYPVVVMTWSGLVPALLFIPLSFMVGGGFAAARVGFDATEVRSLAWAFALVGVGTLGASMVAERGELRMLLMGGAGSILGGFAAGGVVAVLGAFEGRRTRVFVAFAVGGALGASTFVAAGMLPHVFFIVKVAIGVVAGLGAVGFLMAGSRVQSWHVSRATVTARRSEDG